MALTEDQVRSHAWNKATEAAGTAAIFSRRARKIGRWSKWRDFLGVFTPACVGILVADIAFGSKGLQWVIALTAIPSLFQVALSIWSLVAGWADAYGKAITSSVKNNDLRREWEALGQGAVPATQTTFDALTAKTRERECEDMAMTPTEKEQRYGMRYALKETGRSCATCGKIPASLTPTKCGTCGNF